MSMYPGVPGDRNVWALPPRGVTSSTVKFKAGDRTQWTYLCEREECFAMAYSTESEEHARRLVAEHSCPDRFPKRSVVPTGATLIQKLWDEGDDALAALKSGVAYKEMEPKVLQGYIKGLAEALCYTATPYYKLPEDVLRQLQLRWKMSQGQVPFSPTPGYHYNPVLDDYRAKTVERDASTPKTLTSRKAGVKPKVQAPIVEEVSITPEQRSAIRKAFHEGTSPEDLAKIFNITPARVINIAGKKPAEGVVRPIIMNSLFQ